MLQLVLFYYMTSSGIIFMTAVRDLDVLELPHCYASHGLNTLLYLNPLIRY